MSSPLNDVVVVLELGCLADGGDFHILDVLVFPLTECALSRTVLQLTFLCEDEWYLRVVRRKQIGQQMAVDVRSRGQKAESSATNLVRIQCRVDIALGTGSSVCLICNQKDSEHSSKSAQVGPHSPLGEGNP